MRPSPLLAGLGVAALTVAAALGAMAFFGSRDDSTLEAQQGPGVQRPAGEPPTVRAGNVMVLYRAAADRPALVALQEELTGPPTAALQAAGQAMLVRRVPTLADRVAVLSASHRLDLPSPADPRLRSFTEFWLGRESR